MKDGVLAGALPAGDTWPARVQQWLDEMQAGRRLVMVAEFGGVLVGMGQLVFRFAKGYEDAEAANGSDIAMIDSIRMKPDAPANLSTHIVAELAKSSVSCPKAQNYSPSSANASPDGEFAPR